MIARDRGDGSYDVDYDDGEKESGVQKDLIRALASAVPTTVSGGGGAGFAVGTAVEAKDKGKSKY